MELPVELEIKARFCK
uniref:Uncharacterized protein n=1 Tax=Anguilla anguilla TaxID=7936 RepID=A0A0E9XX62_ANGAN